MKKTSVVTRCGYCGKIKWWKFWIRLTDKQTDKLFEGIKKEKISIDWTACPACKTKVTNENGYAF